ncbi:MAG TPA: hypothetical protein PKA07_11290 [Micropruina sp.]|nr:hypothetical protein [Micropruina sp.]
MEESGKHPGCADLTAVQEQLGLSRAALARELGLHRNTANAYAHNKQPIPRYIALACAALLHRLQPVGESASD